MVCAGGVRVHCQERLFLFLLWAASFVTFLLLRRHDLGVTASLGGAVIVLMSGALNQNLGAFMGQTASCLPLTLYATRLLLDRPTPSGCGSGGRLRDNGARQLSTVGAGDFRAHGALLPCRDHGRKRPQDRALTARRWAAATLLSVGLVGFYYGPAFHFSRAVPQVAASYRGVGLETMPLVNAFQLLSPTIFGGVQVYLNGPFTPVAGPHIPYVGIVVFSHNRKRSTAWDIFRHPAPYIRLLQTEAGSSRVFAVGAPYANTNEAFRISTLDSLMAFNPPRMFELYSRYASPPPGIFMREAASLPPDPVLDRMNVSFIGARNAFPWALTAARDRNYRLRFDDGYVSLFERATRPRFWFSSEFVVLPREAGLEAVGVAGTREVILEAYPGFDSISSPLDDPPVTVEAYHRNAATLLVDAPRPGLLYASESFFDGWTASVNGAPAPILRQLRVPRGRGATGAVAPRVQLLALGADVRVVVIRGERAYRAWPCSRPANARRAARRTVA